MCSILADRRRFARVLSEAEYVVWECPIGWQTRPLHCVDDESGYTRFAHGCNGLSPSGVCHGTPGFTSAQDPLNACGEIVRIGEE